MPGEMAGMQSHNTALGLQLVGRIQTKKRRLLLLIETRFDSPSQNKEL